MISDKKENKYALPINSVKQQNMIQAIVAAALSVIVRLLGASYCALCSW